MRTRYSAGLLRSARLLGLALLFRPPRRARLQPGLFTQCHLADGWRPAVWGATKAPPPGVADARPCYRVAEQQRHG